MSWIFKNLVSLTVEVVIWCKVATWQICKSGHALDGLGEGRTYKRPCTLYKYIISVHSLSCKGYMCNSLVMYNYRYNSFLTNESQKLLNKKFTKKWTQILKLFYMNWANHLGPSHKNACGLAGTGINGKVVTLTYSQENVKYSPSDWR